MGRVYRAATQHRQNNSDNKSKKGGKDQNRYDQAQHLTQDINGKVTTSQIDFTNESQEASPFPAGDHKASINRPAQKHNKNKNKTEITYVIHKRSTTLEQSVKIFYWMA